MGTTNTGSSGHRIVEEMKSPFSTSTLAHGTHRPRMCTPGRSSNAGWLPAPRAGTQAHWGVAGAIWLSDKKVSVRLSVLRVSVVGVRGLRLGIHRPTRLTYSSYDAPNCRLQRRLLVADDEDVHACEPDRPVDGKRRGAGQHDLSEHDCRDAEIHRVPDVLIEATHDQVSWRVDRRQRATSAAGELPDASDQQHHTGAREKQAQKLAGSDRLTWTSRRPKYLHGR